MKKWCIILLISLNGYFVFAQNIVTDTVYVPFQTDSIIPSDFIVSSITDKRGVNPKLVSYSQIKKYALIPVDQELCIDIPLSEKIHSSFLIPEKPLDTFCFDMNYFIVERIKGRFYNPYILKADLAMYRIVGRDTISTGKLIYNYTYQAPKRNTSNIDACSDILNKWNTRFKMDILEVSSYIQSGNNPPDILIETPLKRSHFLNVALSGAIGLDFWQSEAEMYFTRPETSPKQVFIANIIRYQNSNDFEMVGFGKKSEHYYKRLNERLAFDVTSNFLLGLMKWKVKDEIKLYQLFQFSLSSSQCLAFNKMNKQGWLFKAGLFENLFYSIDLKPGFQIGMYCSLGYKF